MKRTKSRLKKWLLKNKKATKYFMILSCFFCFGSINCQISNYISNGSFESLFNCNLPDNINKVKYWRSIDSITYGNILIANTCYSNSPYTYFGFEYPRTGNCFAILGGLCQPTLCANNNNRGYLRNRLKSTLTAGKTYCVKFHVNISENSSVGIDAVGIYFGDANLDTITKINIPLTYISPQISNPIGNIISDTLNWIPITGTFVANGTEKHCVIGNFKSDLNTTFSAINHNPSHIAQFSPCLTCTYTNIYVDDVSCIPLDLTAYAAPSNDIWAIPGNTIYIGRPQDVGIDEACEWFKLPNTTSVIANAAGLTLTVAITTNTYMVKQTICGNINYDTVVVHASGVGLVSSSGVENSVNIYPNPASELLNIEFVTLSGVEASNNQCLILNNLGQVIQEQVLRPAQQPNGTFTATINTKELLNGVYVLKLCPVLSSPLWGDKRGALSKRFVIAR